MTTQTIFRRAHTANFVTIPNDLARDVSLGNRERGLLVWLLSYPSDWNVHLDTLVTAEDGLKAVRRSVQKLEDAGYVKRHRERHAETGRLGGTVFLVYDEPLPPEERSHDKRRKVPPMSQNVTVEPMSQNGTQAVKRSRKGKPPMSQNPSVGFRHATKTERETKTETTTKQETDAVVVEPSQDRPLVFRAYEEAFGLPLTPMLVDELKLLVEEHTETWVIDAMRITAVSGKRSLGYAKGILRRWQTEGRNEKIVAPAPVVMTDTEKAAHDAALEAERAAWREAQGLA